MIYTLSEIANMAVMPREPMMDTVVLPVDTVNALIADWRSMREYIEITADIARDYPSGTAAQRTLRNLKVKP